MVHEPLSPIQALRLAVEDVRASAIASIPLIDAEGAFLAEPLEIASTAPSLAIAERNGYALPVELGSRAGEPAGSEPPIRVAFLCARMRAAGAGLAGDFPETSSGEDAELPVALRVESGDPVPGEFDRVLPVDRAVVVGTEQVEFPADAVPRPGAGLVSARGPLVLPAGARVTPRLQALLLAERVPEINARPGWPVGFAAIGSELVDVLALGGVRARDPSARVDDRQFTGDVVGFWLSAALRGIGLGARSLGVVSDEPEDVIALLLRAERQGLGTVVLTGGLGDGVSDRTVEAVRSSAFRIRFDRIDRSPPLRVLYAQGLGMDLFVLSGRPRDAAIGFDLLVGPALLAARGAPPAIWDWSRNRLGPPADERVEPRPGARWRIRAVAPPPPASARPSDDDGGELPWISGLPGQSAWELRSPPDEPPERRYRVPCRG